MHKPAAGLAVAGAALVAAPAAQADPAPVYVGNTYTPTSPTYVVVAPDPYSYGWNEPYLATGIGIGINVGGGITGFTDQSMRNITSSSVGGLWDVRATIGSHTPLGIDISYLGEANGLRTLSGASNGNLIGTTVEGALRWNMLPHYAWNPYVFAGIGWQNFQVTNMQVASADTGLATHDNDVEFPMGAGLGYRDPTGFTVDVRGTFRAAPNSTLLFEPSNGNYASAHSWEASASLGYEF
jgi:hypothetical protein